MGLALLGDGVGLGPGLGLGLGVGVGEGVGVGVGVGVPPPEPLFKPAEVNVLPHPVRTIIDDTHMAMAVSLNVRFMVCSP